MFNIFRRQGGDAPFDPTYRFSTSWILSPLVLALVRTLFAVYGFTTLFFTLGWDSKASSGKVAGQDFSYFTILTYWGLAFYNAFSALHSFSYWFTGVPFLNRWPRVLQVLHSIYYSSVVTYPFLVTIVYWVILYSDGFTSVYATWRNTSEHGLNSAFALFEVIFPRTLPLPWLNLAALILILALYLTLAYITYYTQHFFVYDFLDFNSHSDGSVTGYCFGILAGIIVVFVVVRYVIWLRVWVTEKKMEKLGKTSRMDGLRKREREPVQCDVELGGK